MQSTEMMLERVSGVATASNAKQWLRELPISDARSAHHAVSALLRELSQVTPGPRERLEILETVRGHVAGIDLRYARRYVGKPLPLGVAERSAFNHAQAQWRALAAAYLEVFEASLNVADLAPHHALCLARAGGYFCDALKGYFQAGQAVPGDLIADLQLLRELAGEYGLLDAPVRDSLHPRCVTSVALTYCRALLIGLAGPVACGLEREVMFDLAYLWEGKITCTTAASDALPATVVPSASVEKRRSQLTLRLGRWQHLIDVTQLARSLRRRLRILESGATFEEARLPDVFRQVAAADVLRRLQQAWCDASEERALARTAAHGAAGTAAAQAVGLSFAAQDYEAMHYMVAGKPFALNEDAVGSRRRYDELFVFQHASLAREENRGREAARLFEDWVITDESADGFRLRRARSGARLRIDQLLAMRLRLDGDDGPVVLARTRWLAEPDSGPGLVQTGALDAGVELLKGKPHAVGIREAGRADAWCAGFRLGSLHAKERITLVAPCGWFKPDRAIDMSDAGIVYHLCLAVLLHRGCDFEQIDAVMVA